MHSESIIDQLETDFGTAILSDLTGQRLTRNGQPVRLLDQTRHSSEVYYRADERGKPYVQNFNEGKRSYPFTAYCQLYRVNASTAIANLCQQYGIEQGGKQNYRNGEPQLPPRPTFRPPVVAPVEYIPADVYQPSQTRFERNGLFAYLSQMFDKPTAQTIFEQYRLGTSRRWQYAGMLATCLPQFDKAGNLRQVKVITFHPTTGRRAKRKDPADRWNPKANSYEADANEKVWFGGKSLTGREDANLVQCYFGEHLLLLYPGKPVAIVEGESTALVMSVVWPEYIWLATGGATGGKWDNPEKFDALRGRKVVLWPDSGKYADWSAKAEGLQGIAAELTVSKYVEENAPAPNLDLRDLLPWVRWIRDGERIPGEPLPVTTTDDYPPEWDAPNEPSAVPCISAVSFHEWQQQNPYFSQMGLNSIR